MKKNIINTIISCMLAINIAFGCGWFIDMFENIFTTKTVRTVYFGHGATEQHVTIRNINNEIIDEYVILLEEGV